MNAEDEEKEEYMYQQLRSALLYSVGQICDSKVEKQLAGDTTGPDSRSKRLPNPSRATLTVLSELVLNQTEALAVDLQMFANHANRKTINTDDVLLCARKHASLYNKLEKYRQDHKSSGKKKRKQLFE